MKTTERASRLLQIITTLGLRQFTVLPFGVTNGPPYFQEGMLDLYGGASYQLPSLLDDFHSAENRSVEFTEDAWLGIFVDDIMLGTGDAHDLKTVETANGTTEIEGFDEHYSALLKVFERARVGSLRFKLSKMSLFQFEIECLGMDAGLGALKASSKKTSAVSLWPRPQTPQDVESFLASMVFIREHLSPQFSHIAKPLRDLLKDLQASRKAGRKTKKRFAGAERQESPEEWPEFWNQEAETAFTRLKELASLAVDLAVPDFAGLANNENDLHIWPDACAYGVGGGLFQGSAADDSKGSAVNVTHYSALGVTEWSTKAEITQAFSSKKTLYSKRIKNPNELEKAQDAYDVLSDTEKRATYDESLGLARRRRDRCTLRPLGFYSKSLDVHQRRWTTCE